MRPVDLPTNYGYAPKTNCSCSSNNVQGIVEDLLGGATGSKSTELITIGISIDWPTTLKLTAAVVGGIYLAKKI